ncbi:hypothetical protein HQN87_27135 [Paenibacillus tritici]|uniref:Uncharacterized protein n=1 Tax=Paenibacillus tritici TaxID=1873425 RepID=A0ABX2DWA8_9BACL|nr:hypothetical protein [Paenibacillus tritici]NQX49003.1 hypothetical protein [Paenibacillus tritici]
MTIQNVASIAALIQIYPGVQMDCCTKYKNSSINRLRGVEMLHFVQQPQPEGGVVKEMLHFVQQSRSGGGVMTEMLHLRQDFK